MAQALKILIIDDEPRMCKSLKTLLNIQNYEVETCNNGNQALTHLADVEFDLVLLDVCMEEMDGFQVMEEIRNQKIETPVIIMTGTASTNSAVKALRMGARDYLQKPFEHEELYSSVKNVLNKKRLKNKIQSVTKKSQHKDLNQPDNLKATFKAINIHLSANAAIDETLEQQFLNLLFCKIYDEKFIEPNNISDFRADVDEDAKDIKERILDLFNRIKSNNSELFNKLDCISLDKNLVKYVVLELQNYCLSETDQDIIDDAFEIFIKKSSIPKGVVKIMVEILDPDIDDLIIDPVCGNGEFLIESLMHVWRKLEARSENEHWDQNKLQKIKMEFLINKIKGIDKDHFFSKVAKIKMMILGDSKSSIFNENSLEKPENWQKKTKLKIEINKFSTLFAIPPFNSNTTINDPNKLSQFALAHEWILDKTTKEWKKGEVKDNEVSYILFIERYLQLLKDGGRMAVILPDGIYGNDGLGYIRNWLLKQGRLVAIIDLPIETFMPNNSTKTKIMIFQKFTTNQNNKNYPVFMAFAETCGHDRRGEKVDSNDILQISNEFKSWAKENKFNFQAS